MTPTNCATDPELRVLHSGWHLNEDGRPLPRPYKRIVLPREYDNPFRDAVTPD